MTTYEERHRIIVDLIGEKAYQDLERDAMRFAETTKRVVVQQKSLSKQTQVVTRNTAAMGHRLQNSAYQLGDFLVQVEAGTPVTRAFGQQASQLLGAFGPWGAVVGVAAATVPILTSALLGGEAAADGLETAVTEAEKATSTASTTFSSISFENWNREFNSATESTQRLYASLLDIDAFEAQRKIAAVREAILSEIGEITSPTMLQSFSRFSSTAGEGFRTTDLVAERQAMLDQFRGANLVEEFGVDEARARTISNIMESFETGLINMSEFSSLMITLAGDTEGATAEFYKFVRQLAEAEAANRRLVEIQQQQKAVQDSLRTGTPLPENDPKKNRRKDEVGFTDVGNIPFPEDGLTDYEQHRKDLFEDQRRAVAEWIASMEELRPLGEQVFGSFTSSFDSMVNGIAQGTQSIQDAFGNMARAIIADLVRLAAYRGILALLGGPGTALGASFASQTGQLQPVQAYAKGGIVNSPTMFPMARGMGLMAEAGPEAIMPLGRLPGGDLGVKGQPLNLTINTLPGQSAEVTQAPDGSYIVDIVRAVVAGDVARGGTPIANAIGRSFGLDRAGV